MVDVSQLERVRQFQAELYGVTCFLDYVDGRGLVLVTADSCGDDIPYLDDKEVEGLMYAAFGIDAGALREELGIDG